MMRRLLFTLFFIISIPFLHSQSITYGGFDIETASIAGSVDLTTITAPATTLPTGVFFSPDGLSMFVSDAATFTISQFDLTTPFDVTTSSFNTFLDVFPEQNLPSDVTFSSDGLRMFVPGFTGSEINQYDLTSSFDFSTLPTFDDVLTVATQEVQPSGIAFSNDGARMFVVGIDADAIDINEFSLTTPFDVTTATPVIGGEFDITTQQIQGLSFSSDGLNLFVAQPLQGIFSARVTQFDMSTPYDIASAVEVAFFDVSTQDNAPLGMTFSGNGLNMFTVGNDNNSVFQYSLTSGGIFTETALNTGAVEGGPFIITIEGETFTNAGGTLTFGVDYTISNLPAGLTPSLTVSTNGGSARFSLTGNATANDDSDDVTSLTFTFSNSAFTGGNASAITSAIAASTNFQIDFAADPAPIVTYGGFDIATASFTSALNNPLGIFAEGFTFPTGVFFSDNGASMFVMDADLDEVGQYNLSTPFDITTAVFISRFNVGLQETIPADVTFSSDGLKMYIPGFDGGGQIHQYDLTTPFTLSTASFTSSANNPLTVGPLEIEPTDIAFSNDGLQLFVLGQQTDAIQAYSLSSAFDITTATFVSTALNIPDNVPSGMAFTPDGLRLFIVVPDQVFQYDLTTAFDLATASFTTSINIAGQDAASLGIDFSNNGLQMFTVGNNSNSAFQFDLTSGGTFTEAAVNDGSVEGSFIISIENETFTNAGSTLLFNTDYSISNLPAGLTPVLTVSSSGSSARLTFTGNAISNLDADDVTDLLFTFENSAFTGGDASIVTNATNASTSLAIDFDDPVGGVPAISINDVTIAEGDTPGTSIATFTVSLDISPSITVSVDAITADGTATAGSDYVALASTPITFNPGVISQTVDITINGDDIVELDEGFFVNLSNPSNATIADAQGAGTILNDDQATVTVADVSVNEDDGTATLTLTLDVNVDGGFDVDVSTADNTATTADADYAAVNSATETFAGNAGETQTLSVTIGADTQVEADELIDIVLSNVVASTVDAADIDITDGAQITILNDDQATVTVADVSVNEDDGTATLTLTLDVNVDGGFDVDVSTADNTATTADADYAAVNSATETFAGNAGETQTLSVTIGADTQVEADELIDIVLSNVVASTVDAADIDITDGAQITILNDDQATVTVADVSVNEDDGTATLTLTLDVNVDGGFDVDVSTADNTATTADADYAAVNSATETFAGNAGETQTLSVTIGADTQVEADELIDIVLSNVVASTVDAADIDITDGAQITILNDDQATVTVADVSVNEDDGTATLTLTLDVNVDGGFDVDVSTADNTATTADADYAAVNSATETFAGNAGETQTLSVTIGADTQVEADELIDIVLSNVVASTVDAADIDITDGAQITILNDDQATVTVADVSVNEDDGTATLTLTLDVNVDGGFDVDVSTADNTATTADADYAAVNSATETFAGNAGETQTLSVSIGADTQVEADELIDIVLSNVVASTVDAADIDITDGAQITILNDDQATVTVADVSVNEDDGTATLTLTLDVNVDGGFDVDVSTADNTATTADADYAAVNSATETFAGNAGETQTLSVTIGADTQVEADELIDIVLSNVVASTVDAADIDITDGAQITILNDDQATVTVADVSFNEDDGTATLTLTLDVNVDGGFDVDVSTADNTATTADADYAAVNSATETFAGTAGETQTLSVTIGADTQVEADELIDIVLSNVVASTVDAADIDVTDGAQITILNDDQATVTVADVSFNEDDGTATLTLTLDVNVDGGFDVDVSTADNTATTADADYAAVNSATETFAGTAGETQTLSVTIGADTQVEADELIDIVLSNVVASTVDAADIDVTDGAQITILNDDQATVTVADVSVNEDDGTATLTLTLGVNVDGGFDVDVGTADNTATTADADYAAVNSATETFAGNAGETRSEQIPRLADELIDIVLSNVVVR